VRRGVGRPKPALWLIVLFIGVVDRSWRDAGSGARLNQAQVTLDQQAGDQPIRYTFQAFTDASEDSRFDQPRVPSRVRPQGIQDRRCHPAGSQPRGSAVYGFGVSQVVTVNFTTPLPGGTDVALP